MRVKKQTEVEGYLPDILLFELHPEVAVMTKQVFFVDNFICISGLY